jgi:hypothetical protein
MTAQGWLGFWMAAAIAVTAFASCKGATSSGTGGARSTSTTGTGTGGAGGGAGGAGGQAGDGGPIICLAAYTNVDKNGPCNLIDQNCPPGYTCLPSGLSTSCSTASSGLKGANEPCYAPDECEAKLTCIGLDPPAHPAGACLAFCCNDSSNEPCKSGVCNVVVGFGSGAWAYMCSYGQPCELFAENACPSGYNCNVEVSNGVGVPLCLAPSAAHDQELETCTYINDCGNMQDCWTGGDVCLYYCDLSGADADAGPGLGGCPTGEKCLSTYNGEKLVTGISGVGLCIPDAGIVPIVPDAGKAPADAGTGDAGGD